MTIANMIHISFNLPEDEKLYKRFLEAHRPQDGWKQMWLGTSFVSVYKQNVRKEHM